MRYLKSLFFKTFLVIGCLQFAGCGFQPLYKNTEAEVDPNTEDPKALKIEVKSEKYQRQSEYALKKQLSALLASVKDPRISKISVNLKFDFQDIGYRSDVSALRKQGRIVAEVAIYSSSLEPLYTSRVESISSFNLDEREDFSNILAENSAKNRIVGDLAHLVSREVFKFINTVEPKN